MKRRFLEKSRKGIAWVLTVAMLLSSESVAMPAFAEENLIAEEIILDAQEESEVSQEDAASSEQKEKKHEDEILIESIEQEVMEDTDTSETEAMLNEETGIIDYAEPSTENIEDMTEELPVEDIEMEEDFIIEENLEETALLMAAEAPAGSLQEKINQAEDGIPSTIDLDKDYSENLIIPDGKEITLNLNSHKITPVRNAGVTNTIANITVFGKLTLKGSGSIEPGSVQDVRGLVVINGGELVIDESATFEVKNFKVKNGSGAGILVSPKSTFRMYGGTVCNNEAADYGGGVFAYDVKELVLDGGLIKENKAKYGAGMCINNLPKEDFEGFGAVTISGNTASIDGGGIYFGSGNTNAEFTGTQIVNNTATTGNGGGICYAAATTTVFGKDTLLNGNTAGTHGGGMYQSFASTFTFDHMTVEENTAGTNGGGVLIAQGSTVDAKYSSFCSNSAGTSGGGFMVWTSGSKVVSNVTLKENTIKYNMLTGYADGRYGAGLYTNYANIEMNGDTISENNRASHGGGAYCANGTFTLNSGEISNNKVYLINGGAGAGLNVDSSTFYMKGGIISGNKCENGYVDGGGVYQTYGNMIITNGTISGNQGATGGGIRCGTGNLTLEALNDDCVIIENNYASNSGGGFRNFWDGNYRKSVTTIEGNVIIRNNEANTQGGFLAYFLEMDGGKVYGNKARASDGGAWAYHFKAENAKFYENTAVTSGGGIGGYYSLNIDNCEVRDNKAGTYVAGVYIANDDTYTISDSKISNSTISGNVAATNGGGLYITYGDAKSTKRLNVELENTVITGNQASYGGGIYEYKNGHIVLKNGTEITDNKATTNGGGICLERYSNELLVQGGILKDNLVTTPGNIGADIFTINTLSWQDQTNKICYKRPVLNLCPAENMKTPGTWYDQTNKEFVARNATIDNTEKNQELEKVYDTTTIYEGYRYTDIDPVAQIGDTVYTTVQKAVDAITPDAEEESSSDESVEVPIIKVLKNTTECVKVPAGVTAILDLNSKTIRGNGGSVIEVCEGANLTIDDYSDKKEGKISGGSGKTGSHVNTAGLSGGGLFIEGNVTINNGSICDNKVSNYGGAIYMQSNAECIMNGGSICGNSAGSGGGVYATDNAHFVLNDGKIHDNTAGGLWVYHLNSTMKDVLIEIKGGKIYNNTAHSFGGGGLVIERGKITMSGGEVFNNTAGAYNGGGVALVYTHWYHTLSYFEMSGGSIHDNTAANGAGIMVGNTTAHLTITGGEIYHNSASGDGGGIYYNANGVNIDKNGVNDRWLDVTGGKIYDNTAGTGTANDIYLRENSNVLHLMKAFDMKLSYNSWLNAQEGSYITEELAGGILDAANPYYLTASIKASEGTDVARIGDVKYPSIQAAVDAAAAGDVIYLLVDHEESTVVNKSGQITLDLNGYTLSPAVGYAFLLKGESDFKLQNTYEQEDKNPNGNKGIIERKTNAGSRLAVINGTDAQLTIGDGLTIRRFGGNFNGGTIFAYAGNNRVVIEGSTIEGNEVIEGEELTASAINGGIVYLQAGASLTITGGTIQNGKATTNGGAVYAATTAQVNISGGTIDNCYAGTNGGALCLYGGTKLTISGGEIRNGYAANHGGGIYVEVNTGDILTPMELEISGGKISGCTALNEGGGLYYYESNWTVKRPDVFRISGGVIEKCTAKNGGGIRFYPKNTTSAESLGTYEIFGTTIQDNRATYQCGGMYINHYTQGRDLILGTSNTRTVIQRNRAESGYGAIYADIYNSRSILHMTNVDILENTTASNYAGIYLYNATAHISGCRINGNKNDGNNVGYPALYIYGGSAYSNDKKTTITDTEIADNDCTGGNIVGLTRGYFDLERVNFHDNHARGFSGLWVGGHSTEFANGNPAKSQIKNCVFDHNTSETSTSALSADSYVEMTVDDNTRITNNYTKDYGTVACGIEATLYVKNSEISNNTSTGTSWERGGAGIRVAYGTLYLQDGAKIKNNTCSGYGGALDITYSGRVYIQDGSEISGNTAAHGGGIFLGCGYYTYNNGYADYTDYRIPYLEMTGGIIRNNTATAEGGGISANTSLVGNSEEINKKSYILNDLYNNRSKETQFIISGGLITDNHAATYGGGVFTGYNGNLFQLQQGGKIYGNTAGLGQDIYGDYSGNYVGSNFYKQNELRLIKASDMFTEAEKKMGIGWLDEIKNQVITEPIRGKMIRIYALTLGYRTDDVVALIDGHPYTSVQDAVDAIKDGTYSSIERPEILLVRDVKESVLIPGGVKASLCLNGYTLQGINTALTVAGDLTIRDKEETDPASVTGTDGVTYAQGTGAGTITGNGVDYGGGICVKSGGYAKLLSGEISGCAAGERTDVMTNGGAGVCVDSGTFEMAGGKICDNKSRYGSAVHVRTASAKFVMTGGTISDNNATTAGVIMNYGGRVEITGGVIENNRSPYGAALYNRSGRMVVVGEDNENPVIIRNNTAVNQGGAIYAYTDRVMLGNVQILSNKTTNARTTDYNTSAGGGLFNYQGVITIADGTLFKDNEAVRGGAVFNYNGTVNMTGGLVTANRAQMGGGMAQHPNANNYINFMGGGVYDNTSTLTAAGNDFYSKYEGTGTYAPSNNYPRLSLIPAAQMGNEEYNVWKNDSYSGPNRTAEEILEGQYITANVVSSRNLELTAAYFDTETGETFSSDFYVKELHLGTYNADKDIYENGVIDGTANFDTTAAGQETTGASLLAAGDAAESTDENNKYQEDDAKYPYILADGTAYERNQAVDWVPGMDSGDRNGIVRSYDKVSYKLGYKVNAKGYSDTEGEEAGSNPDSGSAEMKNVRVWLEASLPAASSEAEFIVNSTDFNAYTLSERVENGKTYQVLRGYVEIKVGNTARGTFNVTVSVLGMENGQKFKPQFRSWIDGNQNNSMTDEKQGGEEDHTPTVSSKVITVSAAGQYNIAIERNNQLSYTGYFDLESGEETTEDDYKAAVEAGKSNIIFGTMVGFGITAEMYKDANALKGFEIPGDPLEFDVNLKGLLFLDGEQASTDNTAPYFWAYKENAMTSYGRYLGGTSDTHNMDWNDEDDINKTTSYAYSAAPFNSGGGANACYNGGSWMMTGTQTVTGQQANTFHVKVSGYTLNSDTNPNNASDGAASRSFNSTSIKPFSAGYLQVLFPITEEQKEKGKGKYLSVYMEAAVSDLDICSVSGQEPLSSNKGLDTLELYFGDQILDHAKNEMLYRDNFVNFETGLYIAGGDEGDPGDPVVKTNSFMKEDRGTLTGSGGDGSTPLDTIVYMTGGVEYESVAYDTQKVDDLAHYINPKVYNAQTDNYTEFNYMTALNLLQKFDADAYTPVGGPAITAQHPAKTNTGTNMFANGAFYVVTDETDTEWSTSKTKDYELTVLYGAKPDGSNWTRTDIGEGKDDGGVADMDVHREENLIYFDTLDALYNHFGYDAAGNPNGRCVAILYEVRNCCIRTKRNISIQARMKVTSDFAMTGGTYVTTNDLRSWSTYRPEYKLNFRQNTLDSILYHFTWRSVGDASGGFGAGLEKGHGYRIPGSSYEAYAGIQIPETIPEAYLGGMPVTKSVSGTYPDVDEDGNDVEVDYHASRTVTRISAVSYYDGYIKSQYEKGNRVKGTHNGYRSGNTLLLYTLDSSIAIRTDDIQSGSNSWKEIYNIANGERTANFEVTPSLVIASAVQDHELVTNGSQSSEVHIILNFPNGLTYQDRSVVIDYSDCKRKKGEPGYNAEKDETDYYRDGDLKWTVGNLVTNPDGSSSLEISTYVTDITKKLPVINFAAQIGNPSDLDKDIQATSLLMRTDIYATYEEHNNIAAQTHSASAPLTIQKNRNDGLYLDTDSLDNSPVKGTLKDVGEDMQFVMHYYRGNESTVAEDSSFSLVNILPYNGDLRGTEFTGGYRVKEIRLEFNSQSAYNAFLADGSVKYSSGKTVSGSGSSKNGSAEIALMTEFKTGGTGLPIAAGTSGEGKYVVTVALPEEGIIQKADTKSGNALYVHVPAMADANSTMQVVTVFSPLNATELSAADMIKDKDEAVQKGGNIYGDDFVYFDFESMQSSTMEIKIYNRKITGFAWMDMNHDGKYVVGSKSYPSADRRLSGINANLYVEKPADGALGKTTEISYEGKIYIPAVDTIGTPVESIETDAEGRYSFENLPTGYYIVVFNDPDEDYAEQTIIPFTHLSVSRYGGSGGASLNRAVAVYTESDSTNKLAHLGYAVLKQPVHLLAKADTNENEYIEANQNIGLYYTYAKIEKQWQDLRFGVPNGAQIKLNLNGKQEEGPYNADAEYHYTNENGSVSLAYTPADAHDQTWQKVTTTPAVAQKDSTKGSLFKDHTWTVYVPLQAEGASGEVTYTVSEPASLNTQQRVPGQRLLDDYDTSVENGTTHVEKKSGETFYRQITDYTVKNREMHDHFEFTKVAFEDYAVKLAGAKFQLYHWKNVEGTEDLMTKFLTTSPLEAGWESVAVLTSGANGKIDFTGLPTGVYRLVETAAPAERERPDGQWNVTVTVTDDNVSAIATTVVEGADDSITTPGFGWAADTADDDGSVTTAAAAETDAGAYRILTNRIHVPVPTGVGADNMRNLYIMLMLSFVLCAMEYLRRRRQHSMKV